MEQTDGHPKRLFLKTPQVRSSTNREPSLSAGGHHLVGRKVTTLRVACRLSSRHHNCPMNGGHKVHLEHGHTISPESSALPRVKSIHLDIKESKEFCGR